MVAQRFDPIDNFRDEPLTDLGHALFGVPILDSFKIR
jgi:hypothetical protein